jgi:hypothetical protein
MPDYDPMELAKWCEAWFLRNNPQSPMSEEQEDAFFDGLEERFPGLEIETLEGKSLEIFQALLQRYSATKH